MRFRAHVGQILLNDMIYPIKKSNLGRYMLAVRPAPDGIRGSLLISGAVTRLVLGLGVLCVSGRYY